MSAADARDRQASLAEQASRWVVRRSGQPLAPEAQAEFDAWYQADIRHAEAYERLARIWRRMGDIDQARLAKRPARGRKATVAALLIAATAWPVWQFSRDAHPGADYASGNALRVVELPDGSRVTLDAESAIALDYAAGKRVVRLLAGRALFEAAPAAQGGPAFTVTTPDASATALGTRYTVERQEHGTRVAVYEHRVQVHCRICADDRADILDSGDSVQVSARRHRPRRLVKRNGAGLEPRPALVQRCGAAGGGGAIVPLHQQARAGAGAGRAQCAHLRHRAHGRPETRAGTAARADPRADHRPAGTAAAALTATTGMRRPICRLPIGK
ncbi:FecR domain-containing protein [Achromobacter xylosoxidans]